MAETFGSIQGSRETTSLEATGIGAPRGTASSLGMQEEPRSLMCHLKDFVKENPTSAAMWCFGIGFVLGWRLKPW